MATPPASPPSPDRIDPVLERLQHLHPKVIDLSLDRVRRDKDEAVAAALVQSLLARAGAEPRLAAGATDGDYSNGFHWRLIVRPYGNTDDSKAWGMSAYSVSATVSWRGGERTLTTLRLVPPVKPP